MATWVVDADIHATSCSDAFAMERGPQSTSFIPKEEFADTHSTHSMLYHVLRFSAVDLIITSPLLSAHFRYG